MLDQINKGYKIKAFLVPEKMSPRFDLLIDY